MFRAPFRAGVAAKKWGWGPPGWGSPIFSADRPRAFYVRLNGWFVLKVKLLEKGAMGNEQLTMSNE
jgi:hypothetical protein